MAFPAQVATKLRTPMGERVCALRDDAPAGIYAIFFWQGVSHGNTRVGPQKDADALPIVDACGDRSLWVYNVHASVREFQGLVVKLPCDEGKYARLCQRFKKDYKAAAGIAKGIPNSESHGVVRSCGWPFGEFASSIRSDSSYREVFREFAKEYGRDLPENGVLCSFDAVAMTRKDSRWYTRGFEFHRDVAPEEPGHLQSLVLLWTKDERTGKTGPPDDFLRVAVANTFHVPTQELWKRAALCMLSKWSCCPCLTPATSPWPSRGSVKSAVRPPTLGGLILEKEVAKEYDEKRLQSEVNKLPDFLRALLPPFPPVSTSSCKQLLETAGFHPVAEKVWQKRLANGENPRAVFLTAVVSGMSQTEAWRHFSTNIVTCGWQLLHNCECFQSPDKFQLWIDAGGRKSHVGDSINKPCGHVEKQRKIVGQRV